MTVDKIDSVHGRAGQTPEELWASKLARQLEEVRKHANPTAASASPNVNTSASYTPAVHAQAAQYQLYTQAGTLASLNAAAAASAHHAHMRKHPEDIQAVEPAGGATVSTLT